MDGKILLDTNIVIALFAGEATVLSKIGNHQVSIPSIVLGELYYGAFNSLHKDVNVLKIDEFGVVAHVLSIDRGTSKFYGEIKTFLKQQGSPIPENDIWIAALAKQYQLPLATRDKHFKNLASMIEVISW